MSIIDGLIQGAVFNQVNTVFNIYIIYTYVYTYVLYYHQFLCMLFEIYLLTMHGYSTN